MKDSRKIIFAIIIIAFAFFICNRFSYLFHLEENTDVMTKIDFTLDGFNSDIVVNMFCNSVSKSCFW